MRTSLFFLLTILSLELWGQVKSTKSPATPPVLPASFRDGISFRLIGPFRGGRSAAVAGSYQERNTFYFGGVGGGVWKTIDGGSNWKNISDKFFGGSIGAVAVAPSDESILYAGEGEGTMRGNVSEGLGGIWRSDDGGKSWRNLGLKDSRHIIRIVIHPKNPDIVWLAVMGHLFGPNTERGVYKTTDGGKTWKRTLFVNEQTGCSEVVMEPGNPSVLYAGMWRVIRQPHVMESGGEGSGLWKSTDGGETWTNITSHKGLPKGTWGIVGVAVAPSNTDKLYALIENEKGGLYMSADAGKTWTLQSNDNNIRQRAWYYTRVYVDPKNENRVYCPNVEFMFSTDGGKSFKRIGTPHGDHHDLWIDPRDPARMIVADDGGAQVSFDMGSNWSTYLNQPTVQVYRLSTDNAFPYRILGGQQDNSAFRIRSRSYGSAIAGDDFQEAAGGESGYVVADPADPDITYGGSYMGFLSRLYHRTQETRLINVWPDDGIGAGADVQRFRFQWNYPIFFSPHNPKRLYAAGNHLFVTENEGRSWQQISPDLTTNDKSRQAPSGGAITKDNTGVEYYCTIFTAEESALEPGLLWTGSDDGLIHISRDGGKSWSNVTPPGIPRWMMWNSVEIDPHQKGAAYFVGTRYKLDDFSPYIFKTEDYGKTWKRIDNGIDRLHFTRALRADRTRKGLLYAGTEYGLYVSYDDGQNWMSFQCNLPVSPITDLALKNNDLIVGTQGRSIYVLDDLSVVQQYNESVWKKTWHVFTPAPAVRMNSGRGGYGTTAAAGQNAPKGIVIPYWVDASVETKPVRVALYDANQKFIRQFDTQSEKDKLEVTAGMNRFVWNLQYPDAEKGPDGLVIWNGSVRGPQAIPGKYTARFVFDKDSTDVSFTLLPDPNFKTTPQEYSAQFDFLLQTRELFSETMLALKQIRSVRAQLEEKRKQWKADTIPALKSLLDSTMSELSSIEEALHQTKAKSSQDVLNYPIRLDDKLSGLYNQVRAGSGGVSKQAEEAFAEIGGKVRAQLSRLKTVEAKQVPAINQLALEWKLPAISW